MRIFATPRDLKLTQLIFYRPRPWRLECATYAEILTTHDIIAVQRALMLITYNRHYSRITTHVLYHAIYKSADRVPLIPYTVINHLFTFYCHVFSKPSTYCAPVTANPDLPQPYTFPIRCVIPMKSVPCYQIC